MKNILLLTAVFCFGTLLKASSVTHLSYAVMVSGSRVGQLEAICTHEKDSVRIISLQTRLSFPFRKVFSNIQARYRNNELIYATSEKHINDKLQEWITISKQQARYRIESHNSSPRYFDSSISFSVGLLYHFEPQHHTSIFSERLGTFVPIRSTGNSVYEMKQPDGKTNVFTYKNGVCTVMETEMMASRVKFQLIGPGSLAKD